jgi:HEAT repeat protein
MKSFRRQKNESNLNAAAPRQPGSILRFEWPLLIYPALFVITLVLLHCVNRSIEQRTPIPTGERQIARQEPATTDHLQESNPPSADNAVSVPPLPTPLSPAEQRARAARAIAPVPAKQDDGPTNRTDRPAPAAATPAAGVDQLQGPARFIALLQMAAGENDHTRIKECLDELVALGDAAVVPLNDLLGQEDEAALWAAEALARIGSPLATSALLDTLAQTKEGPYKEELAKRVSSISNHESWPVLLDSVLQTGDATVVRAASASLSRMADTPVVDALVAYYEVASTEVELERLTQLVGNIQSPAATEALLALAGDVSSAPQDALQKAAIEALAKIGGPQCVSHLLRRLEAAPPGEGTEVFNAITQINQPEAYSALLYAAAGNKEVSAESGRTAAIYALKNYPSEQTMVLLERIIEQEYNDKVRAAATRTLDDLKLAPHSVVAKAEPTVKEEHILPPPPEKK